MGATFKTVAGLIKNDRLILIPFFCFVWLSCAMFEFKVPGIGEVSVSTKNHDLPVCVGLVFTGIWMMTLYFPPPERRTLAREDNNVTISHVSRNLASRVIGTIEHNGKGGFMLFEDALKLRTEHHELQPEQKDLKITGLQLDVTTNANLTERAVREIDGKTLIRSIHASDETVIQ